MIANNFAPDEIDEKREKELTVVGRDVRHVSRGCSDGGSQVIREDLDPGMR